MQGTQEVQAEGEIIDMAGQGSREIMGNKTCKVCFSNEATHFCDCKDPPVLFCFDCFSFHSDKNPQIVHQIIPINALGRKIRDYQPKYKALMKVAAELRKNVEKIDQCCHEFEDLVKTCARYLTEYCSWKVKCMQTEKEELSAAIEAAVLEVTTCLDQNLEPESPLAWAIWTLLPEEMQVVSYSVCAPDLQTILQTCISYESHLQTLCERSRSMKEVSQTRGITTLNKPGTQLLIQEMKHDSPSTNSPFSVATAGTSHHYTHAVQSDHDEVAKLAPVTRLPPEDTPAVQSHHVEEAKSVLVTPLPFKDTRVAQPEEVTYVPAACASTKATTELAQVTKTFLRFFNTTVQDYEPEVLLRTPIQTDQYSTWVVLEDRRVFCSGGGGTA